MANVVDLPAVKAEFQRIRMTRAEHPAIRGRTASYFAGRLLALEGYMSSDNMIQLGLRVPQDVADRCDALRAYLESYPGIRALGRKATRSMVARMALEKGLTELEAEAEKASPPAKPEPRRRKRQPLRSPVRKD